MENIIDPQISLDPASHTYSHSEHPDIEFTSCTRVVGAFFEPFDAPAIAKNLTEKHPKYLGMTPEELQQQWRYNADYGSLVHGEIDAFIRHKTAPVEEPSKAGVDWLQKQPWAGHSLFSEAIIYSLDHKLAGTIDLIVQNPQTGLLTLYDWKTSKKIDREAFDDKRGIKGAALNLQDCNYVHYSLQLSLYAHMLEKGYGATVDSIHILHLDKSNNRVEQIEARRYSEEITQMLNEWNA